MFRFVGWIQWWLWDN